MSIFRLLSCLYFFALFSLAAAFSYAAEAETDLSEVPDEYIEEALAFNGKCEADYNMSQYYDCQCLSVKYLDSRIEKGPEAHNTHIMMDIKNQCQDTTKASGRQYKKCLSRGMMMPKEVPPEKFCECYANTYAKVFKNSGSSPSSKKFVQLQAAAMTHCRRKAERGDL